METPVYSEPTKVEHIKEIFRGILEVKDYINRHNTDERIAIEQKLRYITLASESMSGLVKSQAYVQLAAMLDYDYFHNSQVTILIEPYMDEVDVYLHFGENAIRVDVVPEVSELDNTSIEIFIDKYNNFNISISETHLWNILDDVRIIKEELGINNDPTGSNS